MISLDCESTGVDLYHASRPFFVTIAYDNGKIAYWEWDVNPLTREVIVPADDLKDIRVLLDLQDWKGFSEDVRGRHRLVTQNGKFDCAALASIGITNWPWNRCEDTLCAAHLLASNQPRDLTSLVRRYLGDIHDIQPYEDALRDACLKARRLAKKHFPNWLTAKEGVPGMPSVKGGSDKTDRGGESEKAWKADSWLPRQIAIALGPSNRCSMFCADHPWHTVLANYSNADSAATLAVWRVMEAELKRRGLWKIYCEHKKLMQLAYRMESRGPTISGERLDKLETEFNEESEALGNVCTNIADSYDYDLKLPKGTRNDSLVKFAFDVMRLPHFKMTKAGNPCMDKSVLEAWRVTLPRRSRELAFVESLVTKRKIDTALTYMKGYRRYWIPLDACRGWYELHPFLNPYGTDTIRWSSQNPNEQNISKQKDHNLRYCFGPAPGREWWSLDAKNLELRIPAYETGEEAMIALFEHPHDPPYYGSNHLLNAHTVYPDLWDTLEKEVGFEKVGPEFKRRYESTWYQYVKNGGFAIQYGGGCVTADAAFHRDGCHALLTKRFLRIHGPGGLNQRCIQHAKKHGYVETIPDKSVDPGRGYPLLVTLTDFGSVLDTVPLNYHVQGTAVWWMDRAMVRCQEQLDRWYNEDGFDGFMAMQVHDELVFDLPYTPNRGNLERILILKKLMERSGKDIGIPTPVSVEYHTENWAEGEEIDG